MFEACLGLWTSYCLKLVLDAGKNGLRGGTIGVMAVFDGHIGEDVTPQPTLYIYIYIYIKRVRFLRSHT